MACSLTDMASSVTMWRIGAVRAACQNWYSGRESGSNLRAIIGCGADHLALQKAIELTVVDERTERNAFRLTESAVPLDGGAGRVALQRAWRRLRALTHGGMVATGDEVAVRFGDESFTVRGDCLALCAHNNEMLSSSKLH
ncbi:hypothetical protein BWQ96_00355 [Gracilariopsis chorda]|uniref:Uncharacterized protein n=1 Tax=Gracilariopsis chorda TaxID=448386 RepID=A0A2V3J5W8_9FLOR|nr:hypothetical protein BWQ96_00355 [Gracilariopsis chorda]|eukprot:PXF49703.1 hypothetical protein BWQ96_00355 [Gracilariopsis chorda]